MFTEPQQITVLTKDSRQNYGWKDSVSVLEGIEFNAQALIDKFEEAA